MTESKSRKKQGKTETLPLLPLRDIVVFPHMVVPLFVGREKSIQALERSKEWDRRLVLAAQKEARTNDPKPKDIYSVATVGSVVQMLRLPDGTVKVLVEGTHRVTIDKYTEKNDLFVVEVSSAEEADETSVEVEAQMRIAKSTFENYAKLNKRIPPEMLVTLQTINEPGHLADSIAAHLNLKLADKQLVLEILSPVDRLKHLHELMLAEIEILQMQKKIRSRVKKQMERNQKEYYLNEQMQAIQKELGDRDQFKSELAELEARIQAKNLPPEPKERMNRELKKLRLMPPMSAEATVVRNYIDWVLSLPWTEQSEDTLDIAVASRILDQDHHGLDKPKDRILEYLAVQALVGRMKGPILCLVGPPGVGKTSLAKSVARATDRSFVRISLGGVRDEAEIRGHRRTYIGALPGKIIQGMKRAGTMNPVFLLDEVDKLSSDFRGDPASALLEVLDPEQNHTFQDHYLDLDYDLSQVMFITTANTMHGVHPALKDRMEVIELPGYTEWEKLEIAKNFLIPKQSKENGLAEEDVHFTEGAIRALIHNYTKESGVRNLEREVSSVCRKVAREVVEKDLQGKVGKKKSSKKTKASKKSRSKKKSSSSDGKRFRITPRTVAKYLGPHKYKPGRREKTNDIGLTYGLAVTYYGGDLLPTEVTVVPGKGKLVLTGKQGQVMQESAQAAMSYVRSRVEHLGLSPDFYQHVDIHVHLPEGAIPKDGPSAGITMATAVVSALCRVPVRTDVAMTGEITLRGRVLPIGGLKEKVLAAHRGETKIVVIPKENEKDLKDIPKRVLKAVDIRPVEHMDEVLREALDFAEEEDLALPVEPSSSLDWRTVSLDAGKREQVGPADKDVAREGSKPIRH
jgi:ATP-dependent Lon protease